MTKKKEGETIKVGELWLNTNLPSAWVDNLFMAMRKDDICLLRFSTDLPEGNAVQSQFLTGKNQLKAFADLICSNINYYPTPKKDEDKEKPEKK